MTHQWDTHEDRNNGFFYYGNVICNLWPTFLLLNFSSFIVRVDNSRQHVTVKIMCLRTVQSIAFHWPRWSRNLSRWRSLTGTVAHQGSNLSLPPCLSLPPLLPSSTVAIAPPPTPPARAGARVAAAAPNLSQSRRSPVDAARLAEHGGGPGRGGRPQTDPEGPLQERHALHQRGEDLSPPGDR